MLKKSKILWITVSFFALMFFCFLLYYLVSSKISANSINLYTYQDNESAILYDGVTFTKTSDENVPDYFKISISKIKKNWELDNSYRLILAEYEYNKNNSCCMLILVDDETKKKKELTIVNNEEAIQVIDLNNDGNVEFIEEIKGIEVGIGISRYVFFKIDGFDINPIFETYATSNDGLYDANSEDYLEESVSFSYVDNEETGFKNIIEKRETKTFSGTRVSEKTYVYNKDTGLYQ